MVSRTTTTGLSFFGVIVWRFTHLITYCIRRHRTLVCRIVVSPSTSICHNYYLEAKKIEEGREVGIIRSTSTRRRAPTISTHSRCGVGPPRASSPPAADGSGGRSRARVRVRVARRPPPPHRPCRDPPRPADRRPHRRRPTSSRRCSRRGGWDAGATRPPRGRGRGRRRRAGRRRAPSATGRRTGGRRRARAGAM